MSARLSFYTYLVDAYSKATLAGQSVPLTPAVTPEGGTQYTEIPNGSTSSIVQDPASSVRCSTSSIQREANVRDGSASVMDSTSNSTPNSSVVELRTC